METNRTKIFHEVGGFETLQRVHKIFYDKIYAHPWLGRFFEGHEQAFIEKQQTYFMAEKMGGPREYRGKPPGYTHEHMYITEELFELRQCLLRQSLEEAGVNERLIQSWLHIDNAFKQQIVNKDYASFKAVHTFKRRIIIPKNKNDVIF